MIKQKNEMMTTLERSAKNETVSMIITVLLYAAGAASVPYVWVSNLFGGAKEIEWILGFIAKMSLAILPVYLIIQFGFKEMFKISARGVKASIFAIPAVLVAINNLPIIPLMSGDMSINAGFWQMLPYCLFCLSIGVLEEMSFRGCLLPLFLYKFPKDKKGMFWAIVYSSAIFGAMHLLNLLGGFSAGVFLQVGYSFLIGMICAFALVISENIYLPILMHGIYDIGGFMASEGVAIGEIWTTTNIVWTAISSVIFAIFIIIIFIKKDFPHVYENWNLLRVPETLKRSEDK